MTGDPFRPAGRFVAKVGLAYLFGGPRANDLPNLHAALTGRDEIGEWDEGTQLVWECRAELPHRGWAWYGAWLRSRGTFVSVELLPAALGWLGRTGDERTELAAAHRSSPEAGRIYEAMLAEGPLASGELRALSGLEGAERAFRRALGELQRHLLVTMFGSEEATGSWASSVFELTARAFPIGRPPPALGGLSRLVAAYRDVAAAPDAAGAARLLGAPVATVREVW